MTTTNTPERATARLIDRVAALDAIPGNWCDPMLTGQNAVLPKDQSYKPKEIERLLNAVRQRIEALPTVNTHDALQAENERLREQVKELEGERDKLTQSYRCYSCKQVFEEDHGHGLASEHFGSWLKGDRPKCEDCLRGTATWGGGAHDPFYRVRKEAYEQLIKDSEALKRLRAEQEADADDNALWS